MKIKPLDEQVAIVTGGGTGISRAFTEVLALAGVRVVIAGRREEVLQRTASEVNEECKAGRVFPFACDILDPHQIESLMTYAFKQRGSIDILINNAGLKPAANVDVCVVA